MDAEQRHGFEGDGFTYLKSPIWWGGIVSREWLAVWAYMNLTDPIQWS